MLVERASVIEQVELVEPFFMNFEALAERIKVFVFFVQPQRFRKRIKLQWPYDSNHDVDVRLSSLGNLAVAYGAAGMFVDRFFALPSLSTPSGSGPSILESLSQVGVTGHAGKLI